LLLTAEGSGWREATAGNEVTGNKGLQKRPKKNVQKKTRK
jgi:hypothetical protein